MALDPDTGKLKWYFQVTPHDVWDYDVVNEPVLVDTEIHGRAVKALFQASKNGYFYALDRTNGRFLYAKPFVSRINWTKGLDAKGRPIDITPQLEGTVALRQSLWKGHLGEGDGSLERFQQALRGAFFQAFFGEGVAGQRLPRLG